MIRHITQRHAGGLVRSLGLAALAGSAALALGLGAATAAELGAKDQPIKIAVNAWTGQQLSANITGRLLEKLGYEVEYVTAGAVPQFTAMVKGDLHLQPEVWPNNVGEVYPKALESGEIKIVGPLGLEAKESWVYPPYMEEQCPGLPDYKALYDCAQAFATAETFPKGRLITYPADWGTRSKDLVEAIDLPFMPVAGGSEGAMVAEAKSAVAARAPLLMMFWAPHWLHAEIEFHWVELPPYEPGCDSDPKLGIKDDVVNDCGFEQANVIKVVWGGFAKQWPAAHALVEKLTLTNDIQNRLILEVDAEGKSVEDTAQDWIDNNEAVWKPWLDAAQG